MSDGDPAGGGHDDTGSSLPEEHSGLPREHGGDAGAEHPGTPVLPTEHDPAQDALGEPPVLDTTGHEGAAGVGAPHVEEAAAGDPGGMMADELALPPELAGDDDEPAAASAYDLDPVEPVPAEPPPPDPHFAGWVGGALAADADAGSEHAPSESLVSEAIDRVLGRGGGEEPA